MDGAACALLAGAAAIKARLIGAQFMGTLVLAVICGLFAPFIREAALKGSVVSVFMIMPYYALTGAIGGIFIIMLTPQLAQKLFFWLDAFSMGLAGCLAVCVAASPLGTSSALVLGLLCGLGPGLFRDIALADTPLMLEEHWYAGAMALGEIFTLALFFLLPVLLSGKDKLPVASILCGTALVCILRGWKGNIH